jgi:hypothetical protein
MVAEGENHTFDDCILRFGTKKSGNRRPVYAKIWVLDTTVAHGKETAMRAVKSVPFLLASALPAGFPDIGNTAKVEYYQGRSTGHPGIVGLEFQNLLEFHP